MRAHYAECKAPGTTDTAREQGLMKALAHTIIENMDASELSELFTYEYANREDNALVLRATLNRLKQ